MNCAPTTFALPIRTSRRYSGRMQALAPLRYLLRPLQIEAALFIVVFSLLLKLASRAGPLGLALALTATACFLKYAFILLDHIADGKPGGPVFSMEMANPLGEGRPWFYLAAITIVAIVTELLHPVFGAGWVFALRLLCIGLLPAMIAVHSVTGSSIEALKPNVYIAMAWRMGWGYLCVLIVASACVLLLHFFARQAPSKDELGLQVLTLQFVPGAMRIMMLMYLWLAMFAVLGGALFEYRLEIGYDASDSPERKQARDDAERDRLRDRFIDGVFAEYRGGAYINAWNSIQGRIRTAEDALEEYRWLLARISTWPNPQLANRVAEEMLSLLLAKQLYSEALAVAKRRAQSDADFRPATGEQALKLAQLARDCGDRPLARALLKDFERHFPNDPVCQSASRLAEQLLR